MRDVRAARLAGQQFNRISRQQLLELGWSNAMIRRRVASGRIVAVTQGVFAFAPVLSYDRWGHWMAATLTAPGTVLSRTSATCAWALLELERPFVTVSRPGAGGPRRHGNMIVHRSATLAGNCTELRGIPITSVPRTLVDIAPLVSERALARAVREAVRLDLTTLVALGDVLGTHRRRRGAARLSAVLARYAGLPLERARSGAEVRALEILQRVGRPLPKLNMRIAGEEADLSWAPERLIVEIDGAPFHLDRGSDARKEQAWRAAGWGVRRLSSDDVYERPDRLLLISPG